MAGSRMIDSPLTRRSCLLVISGMAWLVGCGRKPAAAPDKYVPQPEVAQRALDAMLKEWQAGKVPGLVAQTSPQVHITDAHRKAGQRLVKYQILGEVPGDAQRCFAVKVKFANPAAEERLRFIVIGIDPLWIFRHEDFELLAHWEHKMDPVSEQKTDSTSVEPKTPDKQNPE